MDELQFTDLKDIESILCVLGLNFPETATEFQKAFLTLAHLTASCRDYVLKGWDIPSDIIHLINQLNLICVNNEFKQK